MSRLIRPLDSPVFPHEAIAVLTGSLAPHGAACTSITSPRQNAAATSIS
jgi:dihydroxyacid dehydratase/phosphogluconate dehydratase